MADEIIEELWKIKDGIAREYSYDPDLLVAYLRTKKHSEDQKIVNLHAIRLAEQNTTLFGDSAMIHPPE